MNIFFRELRANFKSLLIWSGIVVIFSVMGVGEFSAYYDNPDIVEVIRNMPLPILEALNVNTLNITTITGFFGVMYGYYALIASAYAIMLGADIVSKEERDKTAEFSLVFPVTRAKALTSKIFASIINCIFLVLVTGGGILILSAKYNPGEAFNDYLLICLAAILVLEMIFLALGFLLAGVIKHHKQVSSLAVSIVLGTYILSIISGLSDDLDFLKYFTPFGYFNSLKMFNDMTLETDFLWISAGITAVAIIMAYSFYSRRDINI